MFSSNIDNQSKASAFNKFNRLLFKYYPRFSNIGKVGEHKLIPNAFVWLRASIFEH